MDPEIEIVARRGYGGFPDDLTEKTVQSYLEELTKVRDGLLRDAGWTFKTRYFYSEELLKTISNVYEQEIKYCEFYLDYLKRLAEPTINKWILAEKKEEKLWSSDIPIIYDEWTYTNGKVKASVRIDNPMGKMTRVTLKFDNDNQYLTFIDYSKAQQYAVSLHAKTPDAISEKIETLKRDALAIMNVHLYPEWCREKQRFNKLQRFLFISPTQEA
jgi:hypothetical protein